mmetsp:Transcript_22154/g.37692  ORF Transcript_22154/g.37692 Transcript_22154/m.37692 type:complete len:94 (+) Transcript_22154:523-804(+)
MRMMDHSSNSVYQNGKAVTKTQLMLIIVAPGIIVNVINGTVNVASIRGAPLPLPLPLIRSKPVKMNGTIARITRIAAQAYSVVGHNGTRNACL